MAQVIKILGAADVLKAMKHADSVIGEKIANNMKRAGLFLQRESQKIVPVDTSNLKNSAGTRAFGEGWNTDVIVFYTASYAVWVHEIETRNGKRVKHKPGKSAKFLEKPMRENRDKILRIISGSKEK